MLEKSKDRIRDYYMIIYKIIISELREGDSTNVTINDKLADYISKEEGISIKGTPSFLC